MNLLIVSCVYNDWQSAQELLVLLNGELGQAGLRASILLVDDGSTQPKPKHLISDSLPSLPSVQTLHLRNNVGHQRAIAIGLSYVCEHMPCDAVVVMDADGEDKPADVVRLARALNDEPQRIIFAERTNRSEGWFFKIFYHLYRWIFFALTGKKIRFGNFSIVPFALLEKLVVDMNLWNHYAAAVSNSRLPFGTISSQRGQRLHGRSKLNFTALVIHGLSAMSCFNEIIATRLLFSTLVAILLYVAGIIGIISVKLFTDLAIPGWATNTIGILTIISLQVLLLSMTFMFTLLGNRKNQPFIPLRDYKNFVASAKDDNVRE